jgi:hypothetical protein
MIRTFFFRLKAIHKIVSDFSLASFVSAEIASIIFLEIKLNKIYSLLEMAANKESFCPKTMLFVCG